MKEISTSELKPLVFTVGRIEPQKVRMESAKVGWLHAFVDDPKTKFDVVVKDALGRVHMKRENVGGHGPRAGELINLPVHLGEEIEVSLENVRSSGKEIKLFLN